MRKIGKQEAHEQLFFKHSEHAKRKILRRTNFAVPMLFCG